MKRIYGIQVARGLACMAIIIAHHVYLLEVAYGFEPGVGLNYIGRYGMLGFTSIFFAVSAFFATKAVLSSNERSNPLRFIFKRLLRLYPSYWLAIGVCCILRLCAYGSVPAVPPEGFIRGLFLLPDGAYLLNGEWTMVYDVTLLYGMSSLFANKYMKKLYPFAVIFWGGYVVKAIVPDRLSGVDLTMPAMLTNVNTLGYIVGVLAYIVYQRLSKCAFEKKVKPVVLSVLFAACLGLMFFRYEVIKVNTIWQVLFYYAVIFIAVMSALYLPVSEKNLLVKIGDHSFGIYLLHFTMGGIVINLFKEHLSMWLAGCIAVGISICFGYFLDSICTCFNTTVRNLIQQSRQH